MGKTGLKIRDVSKEHFSSGVKLNEPKFSRLVISVLEADDLLASDVETGKSDPICFVWIGHKNDSATIEQLNEVITDPQGMNANAKSPSEQIQSPYSYSILTTQVCPMTLNPVWNKDVVFPIIEDNVLHMQDLKLCLYVRDEDYEPDTQALSYDELGVIEFSLSTLFASSKIFQKNTLMIPTTWYSLKKAFHMRKVLGRIKLRFSLIFEDAKIPEFTASFTQEYPQFAKPPYKETDNILKFLPDLLRTIVPAEELMGGVTNSVGRFSTSSLAFPNNQSDQVSLSGGGKRSISPNAERKRKGSYANNAIASSQPIVIRPFSAPSSSHSQGQGSNGRLNQTAPVLSQPSLNPHTNNTNTNKPYRYKHSPELLEELQEAEEMDEDYLLSEEQQPVPVLRRQQQQHAMKKPPSRTRYGRGQQEEEEDKGEGESILEGEENSLLLVDEHEKQLQEEVEDGEEEEVLLSRIAEVEEEEEEEEELVVMSSKQQARNMTTPNPNVLLPSSRKESQQPSSKHHKPSQQPQKPPEEVSSSHLEESLDDLVILPRPVPINHNEAKKNTVKDGKQEEEEEFVPGPDDELVALYPKPQYIKKTLTPSSSSAEPMNTEEIFEHMPVSGDEYGQQSLGTEPMKKTKTRGSKKTSSSMSGDGVGAASASLRRGDYELPPEESVEIPYPLPSSQEKNRSSKKKLQDEEDGEASSSTTGLMQGKATSVVRILRELQDQRQFFSSQLNQLTKMTEQGLSNMSYRMSLFEEQQATATKTIKQLQQQYSGGEGEEFPFSLTGNSGGGGDRALPTEEEAAEADEGNPSELLPKRGRSRTIKQGNNSSTGNIPSSIPVSSDGKKVKPGTNTGITGARSSTSPTSKPSKLTSTNPNSASFRTFLKEQKKQQQQQKQQQKVTTSDKVVSGERVVSGEKPELYTSLAPGSSSSATAASVAADAVGVTLVYKGPNGQIQSTTTHPSSSSSSDGGGGVMNGLEMPPHIGDMVLPPEESRYPPGSPTGIRTYLPSNNNNYSSASSAKYATAPPPSTGMSNTVYDQEITQLLLHGHWQEVGQYLECNPIIHPQTLSAMTRNRWFELLSTFLMQTQHVDRVLLSMHTLIQPTTATSPSPVNMNMTGGGSYFKELSHHIQQDILVGLDYIAHTQRNKQGLVATLLYTQLQRMNMLSNTTNNHQNQQYQQQQQQQSIAQQSGGYVYPNRPPQQQQVQYQQQQQQQYMPYPMYNMR